MFYCAPAQAWSVALGYVMMRDAISVSRGFRRLQRLVKPDSTWEFLVGVGQIFLTSQPLRIAFLGLQKMLGQKIISVNLLGREPFFRQPTDSLKMRIQVVSKVGIPFIDNT